MNKLIVVLYVGVLWSMNKFRMVVTGCWHLADNPPGRRNSGYADQIFLKIQEAINICILSKADYLVITGDVFHIKSSVRNSHAIVNRLIKILRGVPCKIIIVPGNHDIVYGTLDCLDKQPLGVVISALQDKIWKECDFDVMPGSANYVGSNCRENILNFEPSSDILLAHAPIVPDKGVFDAISADEIAGKWKLVIYGHIHAQHGIYRVGDTCFVNPGALSRGTISDVSFFNADMSRKPGVAVVEYCRDTGDIKTALLYCSSALPVAEVFRIEEYKEEKQKRLDADQFLSELNEVVFSSLSPELLSSRIKDMNLDEGVKSAALEIVEGLK